MIKKHKSLLIVIFLVLLMGFVFKPVRLINYSNIDKIIITNEAVWGQSPLTLNNDDLKKFKKGVGNYGLISFTMSIEKVLLNLRVDFYKGDRKKYTIYFFSYDMGNSEKPVIALSPHYYKISPKVTKTLNEILQDNNFSMEPY